MKKNQHIVPVGYKWGVRGEGNSRLTKTFGTQSEAINAGKAAAINQQSELFIHGANGRIRSRNSYGRDPFPPKG